MRHNSVKEKVFRGEASIGAMIQFPSPELVELYGLLGFEWIFIDAEHGPLGYYECQVLCRACDALGLSSLVRVPKLDHSLIAKYLETGAQGVAVPHVKTVEDAVAVVQAARYYPEGRRGWDAGASRSSAYNQIEPPTDYFAHSNEEVIVALWIEDVEGMENLDDILQVPGVDVINFGVGDLTLSMGMPGQFDHPEVQAAVAEGRRKVVEAGKVLIGEGSDAQTVRGLMDEGALLISTGVNFMLSNVVRAYLDELKK